MRTNSALKLRRMVMIALFGALAYAVMLLIHIPVGFLTLDMKDALITLCGLYFGPLAALVLALLVPLLEFITVSGTGVYGLIMNVLATAAFSLPVTLVYRYKKSFTGAIIGLLTGVFTMTGVMMLANLWITPYYTGMSVGAVASMIPKLLLPFNFVKAVLNAALVLLLYKSLEKALQKAGLLPRSTTAYRFGWRTALVTLTALLLIAASLFVIFAVLNGRFSFGFLKG